MRPNDRGAAADGDGVPELILRRRVRRDKLDTCNQVPLVPRWKAYAEPETVWPFQGPDAPMTAVLPLMATELPKVSPTAASAATNLNTCDQTPLASRSKAYAEPDCALPSSSYLAPMIAMLPLMATEAPNSSPAAASAATNLNTCSQTPLASRSKAYAEPESSPASSFLCAPMMAMLPLMATEAPK